MLNLMDCCKILSQKGTGKTSTITFIVRLLVAMGKRILVTSYTHAAVDNILMKLVERLECHSPDVGLTSAEVIRVGPKTSVHPSLHSHLAHEVALESDRQEMLQKQVCHPEILIEHTKPSLANLYKVITKAKVVGVSALTIPKTPLLIGQEFDFVIVDEAGQISQPAIIGALLAADKFVLVGDHEQLPPLVQNDVADEAGKQIEELDTSFVIICFTCTNISNTPAIPCIMLCSFQHRLFRIHVETIGR